jgi:glycosyltransferase involved in cell wall biosynthesis
MPQPISVFIITKNEADRIGAVISAVKDFADEILVIDSGSTDQTAEIAQNLGAKFIFNEWKGYGPQKVFGENLCKNKWILNIDADEEVSSELADEIKNLFAQNSNSDNSDQKNSNHQNPDQFCGYKIKIVNKFFGEKKPKKLAYYYNQLRLYNKEFAGFKNSAVHDSVVLKSSANAENTKENTIKNARSEKNAPDKNANEKNINGKNLNGKKINGEKINGENLNEKIGQLKNIISHQSFRSFEHWIEKINSYSSMQAINDFNCGKKPTNLKIILTPCLAFLKAYIIRRYFIYGFNGLIYSYIFAFSRTIKLIKIRELFSRN